jgi:RNA polymerase sigma factor (sigma-70 family)
MALGGLRRGRCYAESRNRPRWLPTTQLDERDEPVATDGLDAVVERDQLERAFSRLPVDQRAVVVLHHLMDLPVEAVADALEIPVGTVKSRLSRAMDGLRAAVEADERLPEVRPIREVVR